MVGFGGLGSAHFAALRTRFARLALDPPVVDREVELAAGDGAGFLLGAEACVGLPSHRARLAPRSAARQC